MKVLVKLFYCVIKLNKEEMLEIKEEGLLMHQIRNKIIPKSFESEKELSIILKELNKLLKVSDIDVRV